MGTLSDYATTSLVDHVFKTAYTPKATLYVALCTTLPTVSKTGVTIVETDYTSYVRKSITSLNFSAASSRTISQILDIDFVTATGAGSLPIVAYAICDQLDGGNVLAFGSFSSQFDIINGNQPTVESGEIDISIGASSGAGFTDIAVHKMLDLMFRNTAWSTPSADIHFGATTATISDSSTLLSISATEVTGGSYARKDVAASDFDSSFKGITTNNAIITFDAVTANWASGSDITSIFICDALTGTADDLLAYDNTNVVDQPVLEGDTVSIDIGDFDCDLGLVDYVGVLSSTSEVLVGSGGKILKVLDV